MQNVNHCTGKRTLEGKKVIQITVIVNRELSETLFEALKDIGVHYITLMPCRRIFLQEKHGIMKMLGVEKSIMDIPMNILTFLITPDKEQLILSYTRQRLYIQHRTKSPESTYRMSGKYH